MYRWKNNAHHKSAWNNKHFDVKLFQSHDQEHSPKKSNQMAWKSKTTQFRAEPTRKEYKGDKIMIKFQNANFI